MAGKKSVAEVALKSTGGAQVQKTLDGVGKATDRVGRQQTRLGQASASAGRQFSAQASGLGGLVAAYAGAAATVFAITAAFQALNAAARAEQTITGVNALASAIGESGPQIIAGLQEITKGQLSIVQTAELANLALSSGFSADQINNLAEISLKASRALGRDLTDSFNRLVRGVTKLEPELLDELGIFTRIEPAAERYAAQVGKVASQLSNFERRQAFANAVAEEGQEKFKDIDTSAETTSESLEKLSATVANLGQKVGAFVAKVLQPLAEAISGNLVASVGAFGILAKFVFGTTIREATGSIENFNNQIESRSVAIIDKLGSSTKRIAQANEALGQSLAGVNLRVRAVTGANEQEFKSLIQLGRAKELTQAQTIRLNKIVDQEIRKVQTAQKALANTTMTEKQLAAETARLERRFKQLETTQTAVNARLAATPKAAKAAAASFAFLAKTVGTVTSGFLKVFSAITTVVTVVSILTTVGSIVLDAFGFLDPLIETIRTLTREIKILLNITEEARGTREVAGSLAAQARGDRDLGFTGQREVQRAVPNALAGSATFTDFVDVDITSKTVEKAIQSAIISGATGSEQEFISEIQRILNAGEIPDSVKAALSDVFKELAGQTGATALGIKQFAEATGRTITTVLRQVIAKDGGLIFKGATGPLGDTVAEFASSAEINAAANEDARQALIDQNVAATNLLQTQELTKNINDALVSGAATAEQLEKRRGALVAKIKNLKDSELAADVENAKIAQQSLELLNQELEAQLAILQAREKIRKTFSNEIRAASQLTKFLVAREGVEGEILDISAKASDQAFSRVQRLKEAFELGKDFLQQQREGQELVGEEAQLASLARDAQTAFVGQFVQSVEAAENLRIELKKIVDNANNAKDAAKAQLDILKAQRDIVFKTRSITNIKENLKADLQRVDTAKKLLVLADKANKLDRDAKELAVDRNLADGLITEEQGRVFKLALAQEARDDLKNFTDAQVAALNKEAELRLDALESERKLQNEILEKQRTRAQLEKTASEQAIEAQKNLRLENINNMEKQKGLVIKQIEGFQEHIQGIAQVLAADIVERKILAKSRDPGSFARDATRDAQLAFLSGGTAADALTEAFGGETALLDAITRGFTEAEARRAELATTGAGLIPEIDAEIKALTDKLESLGFEAARAAIKADAVAQNNLKNAQIDGKRSDAEFNIQQRLKQIDLEKKKVADELGISVIELNLKLAESNMKFEDLTESVATANHTMLQLKMGVRDALVDGLGSSLDLLFQNIADGKPVLEGLGEQLRGIFENVRKQVLQKTLIEPLQKRLTSGLNNMLGIGEKGANNAGLVGDALKTFQVNDQGKDIIKKSTEEINNVFGSLQDHVFKFGDSLQGTLSGVADNFSGILKGVFSNIKGGGGGGGISSFLGSIFSSFGPKSPTPMVADGSQSFAKSFFPQGMASGGFVPFSAYQRLAAGGQARDRVPALLEPGEFVMKRSAANSIGGPALNQMNATGSMGGNVVVNIENKGTPQEATASEPRFDGEKFVIDIITRDLRNNGPVRKALRGGGA